MIDLILIAMILLLSIKGYFNGLIRELVGFVGLIGGIFVASRAAEPVGKAVGSLLHTDNIALLKLIGFLLMLAIIWGGSSFVAAIFTALKSEPHTLLTRSLGMGVAAIKYFLIFSMIIASLFNNALMRENFANSIHSSRLFPIFNSVGSKLINMAALHSAANSKKQKAKTIP